MPSKHKPAHKPTTQQTCTQHDFIADRVPLGAKVKLGDATFVMKTKNSFFLASSRRDLAPFVNMCPHVFISKHHLLDPTFTTPLSGEEGRKQTALWGQIRASLGEAGLKALKADSQTPGTVGEQRAFWESARTDITQALHDMTGSAPIHLRFGKQESVGVVLACTFNNTDRKNILVSAVHVGNRSPLANMVPVGTFLRFDEGRFPKSFPAHMMHHAQFAGAKKIFDYLCNQTTEVHSALEKGIRDAYHRLRIGSTKPVLVPPPKDLTSNVVPLMPDIPVKNVTEKPRELVPEPIPSAHHKVAAPLPEKESSAVAIASFISGLKEGGATPRSIGEALAIFMNEGYESDLSNLIAGLRLGKASTHQIGLAVAHYMATSTP